jgi:hypothetical protein
MIQGLDHLLDGRNQAGVNELRGLIRELLDREGVDGCVIEERALQPQSGRVFRLRFDIGGEARGLIVKRISPQIARRTELVDRRWLPAVGLAEHGPALVAAVSERRGTCVWHVYEDLGAWELARPSDDGRPLTAAVSVIAQVHSAFARHPLLGEARLHGGDLGPHFCETNVVDATYALQACQPPPERVDLHARLLSRLVDLWKQLPGRLADLRKLGGPETLLHGDLWSINVLVIPTAAGLHTRLIDWDHAAVGPASYDLSTFLLRLPVSDRLWALEMYRDQMSGAGCSLPPTEQLVALFETAEYARIANRLIWPAIAVAQDRAAWGWDSLEEVERWFDDLEKTGFALA